MMKTCLSLLLCICLRASHIAQGFVLPQGKGFRVSTSINNSLDDDNDANSETSTARRSLIHSAAAASLSLALGGLPVANAAVGTLPEFSDSEAIIQGLTVTVADKPQLDAMVDFCVKGFDFKVLRQRIRDSVEEVVGSLWLHAKCRDAVALWSLTHVPKLSFARHLVAWIWPRTTEHP